MNQPTTTQRASDALKAIRQAIDAIEAMIDATPKEDCFALGLLGQALADLQSSLASIEQLSQSPYNA